MSDAVTPEKGSASLAAIVGTNGNDLLDGTDGNDSLAGRAGDDTLRGLAGDDTLNGGTGNDRLIGNAGNDLFLVDSSADKAIEGIGGGIDEVKSSASYTLASNIENLSLVGSGNLSGTGNRMSNVIIGNAGNNLLSGGAGGDTLRGGGGDDTMSGGWGDDLFIVNAGDVVTELSGQGIDKVQSSSDWTLGANLEDLVLTGIAALIGTGNTLKNELIGNAANNLLSGLGGRDMLSGGAGDDTLWGGAGDDTLRGGDGTDEMRGGTGDDLYLVSVGGLVLEATDAGLDTVQIALGYTLTDHVEALILTGRAAIDGAGNRLGNTITGNTGANHLMGLGGSDTLTGGLGADTLAGGRGNDLYVVDRADTVVELAGQGLDTVESARGYTLGAELENLVLTGTASTGGMGNELDNMLTGNAGNNVLDGSTGNDTMIGGEGDDRYIVDATGDRVVEASSAGTDTVVSTLGYTLGDNLENLVLKGAEAIDGTGNGRANVITGNTAANVLDGGQGHDTLKGGDGNDLYIVDSFLVGYPHGGDVVVEAVGQGQDTVRSSVSLELADNVEVLVLTGTRGIEGSGNQLDNIITGNNAANWLDGGGNDNPDQAANGNDTIYGMAGDDTINGGGGQDSLYGGKGNDRLGGDIDFTGGYAADHLFGGEGNDTLYGASGDTLDGGDGDDTLYGTLTDQVLIGGAGNDYIDFSQNSTANSSGRIDGCSGLDTVFAMFSISEFVISNVETLWVFAYKVNGTAEQFGAFSHIVGNGGDTHWAVNLNILGSGTVDMSASLESKYANIFTSADGNHITTGAGNETFYSGSGLDTLNGGGGNDMFTFYGPTATQTLIGGAGMDVLFIGMNPSDDISSLVLTSVEGLEMSGRVAGSAAMFDSFSTIRNHYNGAAGVGLDLVGAGSADLSDELGSVAAYVITSALGNDITTGTGNDTLEGQAGDDDLNGGAGDDTLSGGGGADHFVFTSDANVTDTISDFTSGTDVIELRGHLTGNFAYLGDAAFSGSGNTEARFSSGSVIVDLNGDGAGDMTILFSGISQALDITASDFLVS